MCFFHAGLLTYGADVRHDNAELENILNESSSDDLDLELAPPPSHDGTHEIEINQALDANDDTAHAEAALDPIPGAVWAF